MARARLHFVHGKRVLFAFRFGLIHVPGGVPYGMPPGYIAPLLPIHRPRAAGFFLTPHNLGVALPCRIEEFDALSGKGRPLVPNLQRLRAPDSFLTPHNSNSLMPETIRQCNRDNHVPLRHARVSLLARCR